MAEKPSEKRSNSVAFYLGGLCRRRAARKFEWLSIMMTRGPEKPRDILNLLPQPNLTSDKNVFTFCERLFLPNFYRTPSAMEAMENYGSEPRAAGTFPNNLAILLAFDHVEFTVHTITYASFPRHGNGPQRVGASAARSNSNRRENSLNTPRADWLQLIKPTRAIARLFCPSRDDATRQARLPPRRLILSCHIADRYSLFAKSRAARAMDSIDSRRSITREHRFINRHRAISCSERRRRAASLLLLATIEAGFNSYSLNSNSVGQDAGVSSTLTLRLSSKALSPAACSHSAILLLAFFASPASLEHSSRPVDTSVSERLETGQIPEQIDKPFPLGDACDSVNASVIFFILNGERGII
jgi:hypothetical protein